MAETSMLEAPQLFASKKFDSAHERVSVRDEEHVQLTRCAVHC